MDRGWFFIRGQLALLGCVLLLRNAAAAPQGSATSSHDCARGKGVYYNKTTRKCCYRCPAGYEPKSDCPADLSSGCAKTPCQPEFYLNRHCITPRCEACVTCNREHHLVEKLPCTPESNRVCECQAGWYCRTPLLNTCRCALHSSCQAGFGVQSRGTAETDTICQQCPPGTFSDEDSNSQPCRNHTDCTSLNKLTLSSGNATHDKRCMDLAILKPGSRGPPADLNQRHSAPMGESKRMPRRDDRRWTLLAASLLVACSSLLAVILLLRHRRVCAWWIGARKLKITHQAKICRKQIDVLLSADPRPGKGDPLKAAGLPETHGKGLCLGMEGAADPELDRAELLQMEVGKLPEPTPQSHTSNCFENIYIMRAETVIVGSVSERSSGKTCCPAKEEEENTGVRGDAGREEGWAMRYPEQETEFHPESEVTTPVEEEWEFQYSGEKALAL